MKLFANTRNIIAILLTLFVTMSIQAKPDWFEQESEHFMVIYREAHTYLVPHILQSAEIALDRLMEIFDYTPSEKIIIVTFDVSDYGTAGDEMGINGQRR